MRRLRTLIVTDKPAQVRRLIGECEILGCPCSLNWASSQKGLSPLSLTGGQIRPQPLTRMLLERAELIVILPPSRDGEGIGQLSRRLKAGVISGQSIDSLPCQLELETGPARQFRFPAPEAWMIATALQPLMQCQAVRRIGVQTTRQEENLKINSGLSAQTLQSQLKTLLPGIGIDVRNPRLLEGTPYVEARLDLLLSRSLKDGQFRALLQHPDHSLLLPVEKPLDNRQTASQETRILIDQIQKGQNKNQWRLRLISDPLQACQIAAIARQIAAAARLTLKNS